jgi:hypothetical protein
MKFRDERIGHHAQRPSVLPCRWRRLLVGRSGAEKTAKSESVEMDEQTRQIQREAAGSITNLPMT